VAWKILFAISMENNLLFETPKISRFVDKEQVKGDKYASCMHFLPHLLNIGKN